MQSFVKKFWIGHSERAHRYSKQEEQYLSYITNTAIPELKAGKLQFLAGAYSIFAQRGMEHYKKETAGVVAELLSNQTAMQLIRLDEQFRNFTSLEWTMDWNST